MSKRRRRASAQSVERYAPDGDFFPEKLGYLREEALIVQMLHVIDEIDINEIGLKKQFEEEVDRYNKFQHTVLRMDGKESDVNKKEAFDIRTYAKYILKEGKMIEKRELLASLKSRLILTKEKKLILRKYETTIE